MLGCPLHGALADVKREGDFPKRSVGIAANDFSQDGQIGKDRIVLPAAWPQGMALDLAGHSPYPAVVFMQFFRHLGKDEVRMLEQVGSYGLPCNPGVAMLVMADVGRRGLDDFPPGGLP